MATIAAQRGVSVDNLMEELSGRALTEHDTEMCFRLQAAHGNLEDGSTALDELDRMYSRGEDL